MKDPTIPGVDKMHTRCEYIMRWGRTLFQCPRCWIMPGLCMCGVVQPRPNKTRVVVSVHHSEWGKGSNTGSVIPLSLTNCEMLIMGHKDHDAQLQAVFDDPTVTTAVLWPGERSILPSELKKIADERTEGRIAVVAVDATWSGAMRMKEHYPKGAIHVKLPPDSALAHIGTNKSLLNPVRRYRGKLSENGRVSTLEAVAALLYELEDDKELYEHLLENCKIKVDAMCVQKSRKPPYGTVGAQFAESVRAAAEAAAAEFWKARKAKAADGAGPQDQDDGLVEEETGLNLQESDDD